MKKNVNISGQILKIINENKNKIFGLDELTHLIYTAENIAEDNQNKAVVLDVLIYLDDQKLIVLNFETDECSVIE